jgi:uncharacterized protein CbrC (UPF0167 family)
MDAEQTATKFPLYRARPEVIAGHCTTCDQDKPHCLGVSHLLAACPSCGATKAYNVDDAGEVTRCKACDRLGNWPDQWPRDHDEIRVCDDCLLAGRAAVGHETGLGYLSPPLALRGLMNADEGDERKAEALGFTTTVLERFDDGSYCLGIHVPQHLLDELMRTPAPPALQREYWPFHCGGWMQYLGNWQPDDFERQAPGRAVEWLGEHIDDRGMAQDYMSWLGSDLAWSCVYACPRCGTHKVYVDAD